MAISKGTDWLVGIACAVLLGLAGCSLIGNGKAAPEPYYGLAMAMPPDEDVARLGVGWYYTWGPTSARQVKAQFVPMLWDGLPSDKLSPETTGWVLVLNEPNVKIQANVTPEEAVKRMAALRARYPKARLLCCGQSVWAVDWVEGFLKAAAAAPGALPDGWHVHTYTEEWITAQVAQDFLTEMHGLTGGSYWITEYGSPEGKLEDYRAMTEWFLGQGWIKRIAPYTNRQEAGAWWAIGKGVELVNENGELTEIGAYYKGVAQSRPVR